MRLFRICSAGMIVLALVASICAVGPADEEWPFDVLRLKSGAVIRGMLLEETPKQLRFLFVRRQQGRPTFSLATSIATSEIERIERLVTAEREQLAQKLKLLEAAQQSESERQAQIELEPIAWRGQPGQGRQYRSTWFVLQSDASEEIVRRAAFRLEQVYAAYERFLPPKHPGGGPTTIHLFRNREGYQELLRSEGREFINTAFFDPAGRRIVCASDLDRLGDDLDRVRHQHKHLRADLDREETTLTKLYKGKELLRHVQPIRETRQRIAQADKQNEAVFDRTTKRFFATLYHEAFHAYVGEFVYPHTESELPRWLNEGLAQIFETAIIEAGELRVGHADADRLARVKELVRKKTIVPLTELLQSGAKQFQAQHRFDRTETDQYYLTSWSLAFYLTFGRPLVGSAEFGQYLAELRRGVDPVRPFSDWTKSDLAEFEREFHQYLLKLQPDGTLANLFPNK